MIQALCGVFVIKQKLNEIKINFILIAAFPLNGIRLSFEKFVC